MEKEKLQILEEFAKKEARDCDCWFTIADDLCYQLGLDGGFGVDTEVRHNEDGTPYVAVESENIASLNRALDTIFESCVIETTGGCIDFLYEDDTDYFYFSIDLAIKLQTRKGEPAIRVPLTSYELNTEDDFSLASGFSGF